MSRSTLQIQTPTADENFNFSNELMRLAKGRPKGERTRAAIQSALCHCLESSSPTVLTVADICDKAGLAHGTFYIYFSDRNALIGDVVLRFIDFIQKVMRAASQQQPADTVRAATTAYVFLFENNRGLMRCLLNHLDELPEARLAFQSLNREWLEGVVASTVRLWVKKGHTVDHDELMRRAYALGGMTDQYLSSLLLSNDPNMLAISRDRVDVINTLTLLWQRGMEQ